ncbi:MAG: DnaJ domain-containing protein [Thermoflexales bacterium]|nr:DnaJ domain-containing protein [Thermoflexales bacterium]MDW8351433.1 DnaJ domain-containing protein [Anaerolineae bacterium]
MSASDKDYYAIMQVDEAAESAVIAAAYKALAAKYHPDRNASPDATRRMQALNEAYEVLSDPDKRAEYDRRRPFRRNGHANGYVHPAMPTQAALADARLRERFERAAQRIRELQEKSLQQIQAVQERSAQQIRDIQERAAQQVKEIQDKTAQQIREIQQRTAEQIRSIQENL